MKIKNCNDNSNAIMYPGNYRDGDELNGKAAAKWLMGCVRLPGYITAGGAGWVGSGAMTQLP